MNGRVNVPLLQERDAFAELLNALSDEQREIALLEGTYRDILAGPQADDGIPETFEGLPVSELDADLKALLLTAIETYVGDIDATLASAYMKKYTSKLANTYLGYSGTPEINALDQRYVRFVIQSLSELHTNITSTHDDHTVCHFPHPWVRAFPFSYVKRHLEYDKTMNNKP